MKIQTKTKLLVLVALVGTAIGIVTGLVSLRDNLLEDRKFKTRNVVETVHTLLGHYHAEQEAGRLGPAEAQAAALAAVKALRYDESEYFWVNDYRNKMLMHPIRPELDGKDLSGFKDANGKLFFNEFIEIVNKSGAGFLDYYWPKPGSDKPVEKLSYVKGFAPWGWIVGTGIYIEDVDQELARQARKQLLIALGIFLVMVPFSISVVRDLGRSIRSVVAATDKLAQGDFDHAADVVLKNEMGAILVATQHVQKSLQAMRVDAQTLSQAAVAGNLSARADAGHHPRRERCRQGSRRRRAAPLEQTCRRSLRPAQLRAARRRTGRKRAVRPQARRLHRRHRRSRGPVRGRQRRHPVPRRDRRTAGFVPGQAAARARQR